MYDIRQFRPTLVLLIALGFTGFTIAIGTPLLWVVGIALLTLNTWLVRVERFHPLPRWSANLLTLLAALYTAARIYADQRPMPIIPIGNFLVVLQLIKLYEHRSNRDLAQLLVLSLLLMVAAAISTASLLFGIVFVVYLLISPYACLLFHLKVETDHAKRQMGLDERLANPMTLRQDQRFLRSSMARLTGLVAAGAVTMGVVVFLFFPRVQGANLIMWQFRPSMAATGMSEQMNMQSVTRVQQNTAQVASVAVTHNGDLVTGGPLYLRGTTFDIYDGDPQSGTRWNWQRASQSVTPVLSAFKPGSEDTLAAQTGSTQPAADTWVQDFTPLLPTGVKFLLALPGATRISVDRPIKLAYVPGDSLVQAEAELNQPLEYRLTSTGTLAYESPAVPPPAKQAPGGGGGTDGGRAPRNDRVDGQPNRSVIAPAIAAYARLPEVSGVGVDGRPLAETLGRGVDASPATEAIARNIERHLQTKFTYTLDISDNPPPDDVDPIVHFLTIAKTGWCERYASAMTLMCQSLGMKARLVSGYKCDEFNAIGGYFIVRQSHAHAWVEVLVQDKGDLVWKTFDPTSGIDGPEGNRATTAWQRIGHFFDYLEHTWANSVVAYDASAQTSMLDKVETNLVQASNRANASVRDSGGKISRFSAWIAEAKYTISEGIIVILVTSMTLIGVGLIVAYLVQRMRLTRRARRIGLDSLDAAQARRLARQLGFYDDLTRILERRSVVRPAQLTPLEFGRSLDFLPQETYRAIVGLTRVFYRVRYGHAELSAGQRRALARVIDRLQGEMFPTSTHGK